MARVSALEVSEIFAVDTINDLNTFITTAHLIVTEELISSGLSAARLKEIELYLSAHFASLRFEKDGLRKQKIGDVEEEYNAVKGTKGGLESTRYGQQALALDTSGDLASLATSPRKARFRVV